MKVNNCIILNQEIIKFTHDCNLALAFMTLISDIHQNIICIKVNSAIRQKGSDVINVNLEQ